MGLMLLYCFSLQRSSIAQGDYTSLLLCVYSPLLSANHFVSLVNLTVWNWKSKTEGGFLDLVFGKVCFVDCVLKKKAPHLFETTEDFVSATYGLL